MVVSHGEEVNGCGGTYPSAQVISLDLLRSARPVTYTGAVTYQSLGHSP